MKEEQFRDYLTTEKKAAEKKTELEVLFSVATLSATILPDITA